MKQKEWYMEYQINENRPGLLGEISSLLGMLRINILTINGVEHRRRGMLIKSVSDEAIMRLRYIMETMDVITLRKIREPKLRDRLAVRHGRYIERDEDEKKTFRFVRDELGLLVDFMAELFMKSGHRLIGIRGMPRVGKTESVVAASVCANKRWSFLSSTLLRQTIRSQLADDEMSEDHIYIIDGIVSTMRASERHQALISKMMRLPATKVVEHPDIFVRETEYSLDDFDYIIELRSDESEEITYDSIESGFSSFDIS
ncbi:YmfK family protein [Salipaludibacillus agaradhaerens]|uniref:YmfK family protein n=1 Tax=Salipaludibacillus agaradhaerens TaxID=76935 RepID=A0A9Q4B0W0_SALAG|nr:YmfK family protein [Salipaludibacillus agaradhaerens]UJW58087.1 YmfK family protein [Bacillus sp. A116_S68]MCR6096110.1 YmfK family protein [Salipaludibacillus agaradhaerens]MCR6107002.1 YmfK family protein [Salipaludibacillus agaradhaerens]MCR6114331.1 YmfK family protein [Salipaludibacillus agaradhaerens]MCR6119033.1 YmfK family protein [Salipaludibacillus agaradhaerens]